MKALLYKGVRGILKNFQESGTLLDSSVPYLKQRNFQLEKSVLRALTPAFFSFQII